MAKLFKDNDYAFRIDQIAWISLKKADPKSSIASIEDVRYHRIVITLKGNNASNVICFNTFKEAEKIFNDIVEQIEKL